MLLSRHMAEYLEYRAYHQGSPPGSIAQYELTFRTFIAYLHMKGERDDLRSFTGEHVLGWSMHERKREHGLSARTLSLRLSHLSGFAEHLMRSTFQGKPLLTINPVKVHPRPKFQKKPQDFLLPDELERFLAVKVPLRVSVARDLFIDTLLRVSEIANADVGHVLVAGQRTYLQVKVKGGMTRKVPLSPEVADTLTKYLSTRGSPGPGEPLLINVAGKRWNRKPLSNLMARIGGRAGITRIRVSAHKLRHTGNVVARRSGMNEYVQSRLLNHSNTKTIQEYQHLLPDELWAARVQQRQGLAAYLGAANGESNGKHIGIEFFPHPPGAGDTESVTS